MGARDKTKRGRRAQNTRGTPSRAQPKPSPRSSRSPRSPQDRGPEPRGADRGRARPPSDLLGGWHAVTTVLRHDPKRVRALWCWSRDRQIVKELEQLALSKGIRLQRTEPAEAGGLGHLAQGLAVRLRPFVYQELDSVVPPTGAAEDTLVLVLDSITDARNLGAIVRSAAFFRATAVILPQDRSATITPVVERIARGASAIVPIVQVVNLARTLRTLGDRGVRCCATVLDVNAKELWTLEPDQPTAIVLGAEGKGVRPLLRKQCPCALTLSGEPTVDSLNVASFATVVLAALRRTST